MTVPAEKKAADGRPLREASSATLDLLELGIGANRCELRDAGFSRIESPSFEVIEKVALAHARSDKG